MYFKKTDKGQAEIDGSQRQIPQRLRMVLLLVDGRRSAAELQQMLANATPEALRWLLDEGYIASTPAPKRRSSSAAHPAAAPAAAVDSVFKASHMPSRFDVASRPQDEAATDQQRAQIERSLRRALGPTAGSLIETVRQASTVRDLIEVLKTAQLAITNARGKEIGEEFASRYGALGDA
ncbi:MAG: hypothetical protein Q8L49_06790 [Burkholderiaceae bacterium]|nr:hypothetical protein [Burkholderiaceae bacterium]